MGTVTRSVTLVPSGSTGVTNLTTSTNNSYKVENGYKGSGDTSTTARLQVQTSTTGYMYYTFDTSEIPSGATISSISGTVTVRVNNNSRVTNTVCQLCAGTTTKGSNVTFGTTTTSNTVTLSTGTGWTRANLNDLRLKIGATGSSSSQTKYIYFAGATITVNYSVTTHDITISNSTSATVTASASSVVDGDSVTIVSDTISGITIKDNNVDVTSQFTAGVGGTESSVPTSYTAGSSINGTNYQSTIGKGSDTSNRTGNDYFSTTQGGSGSTYIDYHFDFSAIPAGATISSMSVTVKGHCESTSESREISRVQCYTGTTAKGSYVDMTDSTTDKVYTISNPGTWTRAELQDARIKHTIGVYGGLMSGATWSVTYEVPGYQYTIASVTADHTITVTSSGSGPTLYVKQNGSWVQVARAYKKVSGSWQQVALDQAFSAGTNYVKG